ncbi:MAG: copper oxidase, partial [Phycisphaerae bacterium]
MPSRQGHFIPSAVSPTWNPGPRRGLVLCGVTCVLACVPTVWGQSDPVCNRVISADVAALDQAFFWNRLGAAQPQGMIFALIEDLVPLDGGTIGPGNVRLRSGKRPRPLVLRMNVGDCLQVHFQNLLSPVRAHANQPATRDASVHVIGMQLVTSIMDDGSHVGVNGSSLVAPGGSATYTFYAEREGPFVLYSAGATIGGNGNGGTLSAGLFGAVNVQPQGAEWYRSQVAAADIIHAATGTTPAGHPLIDYDAVYPTGHALAGRPVFRMLDDNLKIRHSDLTAIITGPGRGSFPAGTYRPNPIYPNRDQAFREFTIIYHDEIEASQAFDVFKDPVMGYTLDSVQDSFAINYGTAGIGAEILANRYGVGPMWDCTECKYEEFFLSAWAIGDPAMVVDIPANAGANPGGLPAPGPKATKALYPDDPSNVYHSYIGDHVKQRILHGGSQEHHIHHLHAHQWTHTPDSDNSAYLDSQAIGPGTSWTLEIPYRGTGNRNQVVGDSIFHCHFYPHFAQGMWALWRSHDVFEEGTELGADGRAVAGARALPDAEIAGGTPIPAVVPIPGLVMAPMPQADVDIVQVPGLPGGQVQVTGSGNPGYPFFIPGIHGHRPPHPPLDSIDDGGLQRHVISGGEAYHIETRLDFTKELESVSAIPLAETGEPVELAAMDYHAQRLHASFTTDGAAGAFVTNGLPPVAGAPYAEPCIDDAGNAIGSMRMYKAADIQLDAVLNKSGWHFPQMRMLALWEDVAPTLSASKPPEPLFFRANSDDCIEYRLTNLVPNYYELDDFQVRTPTDVLGQHIHLVKFDVTSSDGSGNGWNYEDASFSPDEVRERVRAIRAHNNCVPGDPRDGTFACPVAEPHPFFGEGPGGAWIGAQTTVQRWYADDVLNLDGEDRTLRTVFTHDHFGPSTHQQAGLYAGLVIEPYGSTWRHPETGVMMGARGDGGPTGFRADILTVDPADSYREFLVEFADSQLAYLPGNNGFPDPTAAVLPPGVKVDDETGTATCPGGAPPPCPEAVSDIGTEIMSVNYRNEPLEVRVLDPVTGLEASGDAGDSSHAFRSIARANPSVNVQPTYYPPLTSGVEDTDPFTPLLRAYENDNVQMRMLVGAHTDVHNFSVHGIKWLFEPSDANSGYRNSQPMGISEHFEFLFKIPPSDGPEAVADYLYQPDSGFDGLKHTGLWGILRAYDGDVALRGDLLPLPNNPEGRAPFVNAADFNGVCPVTAPIRQYDVTATTAQQALPAHTLIYNHRATGGGPIDDPEAMLYVRTEDLDENLRLLPGVAVEPLILRAAAGDCIEVTLRNTLDPNAAPFTGGNNASTDVGLHPQLVSYDVASDDGANVGLNPKQTIGPGQSRTYRWYAGSIEVNSDGTRTAVPVEYGATNLMPSDGVEQVARGMIGALIIEPQGSSWVEDAGSRASATVTKADGSSFRDFVLMFQDTVRLRSAAGFDLSKHQTAINYRTEPMWNRFGYDPAVTTAKQTNNLDFATSLSNAQVGGDPVTPIFTAEAGIPVRFRVLHPGGIAPHVFQIHGHVWQETPYVNDSTEIGDNPLSEWKGATMGHGPSNHFDAVPQHGAGGRFAVPGDYLYRAFTADEFDAGIWGIFRVTPTADACSNDAECDD